MTEAINPQPSSNKKSLQRKNILIGVVVGTILIGLGVATYLFLQPKPTEPTQVTTKKTTPSAKISTPSAKKDKTEGWKTIKYDEQGFTFKYPPNKLFLELPENCFRKTHKEPILFTARFQLQKNSPDWENSESYKNCIIPGEDGGQFEVLIYSKELECKSTPPEKSSPTKISGQEATVIYDRGKLGGEGGHIVCFNRNGYGYSIHIPTQSSGPDSKIDFLFDKILSTFRFE